jgi:hypothetical protein
MADHQARTDSVKKVTLTSSIQHVLWTRRLAAPGGRVGLEIYTQFVGNGAGMEIELSDRNGKKHGKYKEKISGNKFWAEIRVPPDARQALIADVKLPKHGLQKKSLPLLLLPPIEITNVQWDKKEARRGDIVKMSADVKTVPDGTDARVQVWEWDIDGAHDPTTEFPTTVRNGRVELLWEYEYHDDTGDIPSKEEAAKGYNPPEYFFRVDVFGVTADSPILKFKDWIEINLKNQHGVPIPNEDYVIKFSDATERKGKLDKDGKATEKDAPPGKYSVEFPNL